MLHYYFLSVDTCKILKFCFVLFCSCKTIPTEQFMSNQRNLLDKKAKNTANFQIIVFKLLLKMETETILWSKHVIILVILNFKLILAILRHQRPLQGSN
jgi:hypothetical protein